MSSLTGLYGGGLKPKFQEFTSSGTFTPSAGLLAAGGNVLVILIGAGGGGAGSTGSWLGGAGGAGAYLVKMVNVSGNITVTIGTGGTAGASGNPATSGGAGGSSTFGALMTALGGEGGTFSTGSAAPGGLPGGALSTAGKDAVSWSSIAAPAHRGGDTPMNAGGFSNSDVSPYPAATAGTNGSGGGPTWRSSFSSQAAGAGGNGYCRVEWWE